jgi:hypothetical protein
MYELQLSSFFLFIFALYETCPVGLEEVLVESSWNLGNFTLEMFDVIMMTQWGARSTQGKESNDDKKCRILGFVVLLDHGNANPFILLRKI